MAKEYKGYGGSKVTIDSENISIKLMFMKEDCKLSDIEQVVFREPTITKNGAVIISTKLGTYDVIFLSKNLPTFKELYDTLLPYTKKNMSPEELNLLRIAEEIAIENDKFTPTKIIGKLLEVDENAHKWRIPSTKTTSIIYDYNDIVSFELIEDGETITKGGFGGAVAGGLLFGGIGAIVGSNTGTKAVCNFMSIKIVLNNLQNPNTYIYVIQNQIKRNSMIYKTLLSGAQECLSVLQLMCNKQSHSNNILKNETSSADEIMKFKNLYDSGIITQEEFEAKKKQLLGV